MNKVKYISRWLFALGIAFVFSLDATAQRGGRGGGGSRPGGGSPHFNGGGRSFNGGGVSRNFNNGRTYNSVNIGIRGGGYYSGNRGYNYYRPAYRPNYGYGGHYNYYPRYRYRPIFRSPFAYSHFGPSFGFRLSILPFGYYPFYMGNDPFYYYNGIYYRPYSGGGYEVTQPPLGATVKKLPGGAKTTVINGQKYYELGGTFYQEEITAKNKLQYVVVGTDGVINTLDENQDGQGNQGDSPSSNVSPYQQQEFAPDQQANIAPEQTNTQPAQAAPSTNEPVRSAKLSQLPANSKTVVIDQKKYYMSPSGVYYQEVIDGGNVTYQAVGGGDDTAPNGN